MNKRNVIVGVVLLGMSMSAGAQKIDFNMSGRQDKEGTETGFTPWAVDKGAADTLALDNGMKVVVNCNGVADMSLRSNFWKDAVVSKGSKIVGDCVAVYGLDGDGNTPHLTDRSATMNIVLKGLAPGRHSMLAYHNVTDGNIANPASLKVTVNGEVVLQGVAQSSRLLLPSEAGQSYVTFTVDGSEDVTISYTSEVETSQTYGSTGVYVNAIVFDQPNPKTTALNPVPQSEDMHVDGDNGTIDLSWTMADTAVKNHVYLGTSPDNMTLVSSSVDNAYRLTDAYALNTYYWRVDQEDAQGNIYQGETWTFRPRHLAFPGAEGYGRYATGGRGGTVYHVTSLDDNPDNPQPGTLRYGITQVEGPRTIVFDVAGTISLGARLTCSDPYVTIAGQTAPGKGILLRTNPFGVASEGITRFIRMRLGYGPTADGLGMAGNNHSIMDHCSVGWTIDEAFSSRNGKNLTLQRTLISEALNIADHQNYGSGTKHGYAATIGGDTGSYHHNLLAHNEGRNWSLSGGLDGGGSYAGRHDIFNNVVYNWGGRTTDGGTHQGNFVNNYYKTGPASHNKYLLTAQLEGTGTGSQSYYVKGNIRENLNGTLTEDKEGDTYRYTKSGGQVVDWQVFVSEPFFPSYATIEPAGLAFKTVLSDVGCNQPVLDDHDVRMVSETLNGTTSTVGCKSGIAGLIDRESDAGGYENYPEDVRPADYDTDQDGMPNWWEEALRLNPQQADNNSDANRDGYTALEDYLNWLAEPHYIINAGEATDINIGKLFAGFNNDPYFEFAGGDNLSIDIMDDVMTVNALSTDGGFHTITLTASDNDNQGSMTRNVNIFVDNGTVNGILPPATTGLQHDAAYSIYTLDGVLLRHGKSLDALAPGIYVIKAVSGNRVATTKVVKR